MKGKCLTFIGIIAIVISSFAYSNPDTWIKGIYLQQGTLENTPRLLLLIQRSRKVGINTFIIDMNRYTKRYATNIQLVHDNGIRYVARIVVFPHGGEAQQVKSVAYWEKKLALMKQAHELGAAEIQLDYIRYNTKRDPSSQHSQDIHRVISWFKQKTQKMDMSLQIAVFGETSFKPSPRIGQDVKLFSDSIDGLNPMLYPSHYFPYDKHSQQPYQTIFSSIQALHEQFDAELPFKLYPYIEMYNFRYPMSAEKRKKYILEEIKAVQDGGANGWYAWSAGNQYQYLFEALENFKVW